LVVLDEEQVVFAVTQTKLKLRKTTR